MTDRVLIASGVRHAADYIDLLRRRDAVEVVGIAESDDAASPQRRDSERLAAATGLPFLPLIEALGRCDAVVVCSEPTRHATLAVQAIAAGRHVLIDKPAATTSAEVRMIQRAARGHPEVVVGSVHRLLSPAIVRARHTIDTGGIGLPLGLDAEWIASGGLDGTTVERPELVCDPRLSGGGELTNFGWYPLLAIAYLSGLKVVQATAFAGAVFDGPHRDFGVEDTAILSLLLERGVTATVTVSRVPAGVSTEPIASTLRVLGSHGHLQVDETSPTLTVRHQGDTSATRPTIGGSAGHNALAACFDDFFTGLHTGSALTVSLDDIAHTLAVLDAARESITHGRPATVPDAL